MALFVPLVSFALHLSPTPLSRHAVTAPRLARPLMLSGNSASDALAAKIDAACGASIKSSVPPPSLKELSVRSFSTPDELRKLEQERSAMYAEEMRRQNELAAVYTSLVESNELRAFGSVKQSPIKSRQVSNEDQLRLTGLPTTAFAPRGSGNGPLAAGAFFALALAVLSANLQIDFRLIGGVAAAALTLDNVAFGGVGLEVAARLLRPAYQRKIIEHEAGHFLVAYLLGCPLEACLLDPLAAAKDPRFQGAAGTIFFDPLLAEAMRSGSMPRSSIDRYSVVVMAGISAEAELNNRAEGGRADEAALIRLLISLDGGRSWDLGRVQNQARWAASTAALIIRAHRPAYDALVTALTQKKGVGQCIVAIEQAIRDHPPKLGVMAGTGAAGATFGSAPADAGVRSVPAPPPPPPEIPREEALAAMSKRQEAVGFRLEEVSKRLQELSRN